MAIAFAPYVSAHAKINAKRKPEPINFNNKIESTIKEEKALAKDMNELLKESGQISPETRDVVDFYQMEMEWGAEAVVDGRNPQSVSDLNWIELNWIKLTLDFLKTPTPPTHPPVSQETGTFLSAQNFDKQIQLTRIAIAFVEEIAFDLWLVLNFKLRSVRENLL